jgi:PAS domain S-box-containing protein
MSDDIPKAVAVTGEGESALRVAIDEMGMGLAQISLKSQWLSFNPRLCHMLGYSEQELQRAPVERFFRIPHLHSNESERGQLQAHGNLIPAIESRLIRPDGTPIWLRTVYSVIRNETTGQTRGLMVLVEEITSQKKAEQQQQEFAGRLMTAQETERSRIARELHDDIGQSLAILSVQLQRAERPVSDQPGRYHPGIAELCSKVQEVATRVTRLSRQLHSSTLEYLGLTKAVRGECKEFSETQRIPVECSCDEIPRELDDEIGLCFLRVIQEALHNIAKHSRATKVKVELTGNSTELSLLVSDNGVGFDLEQARLAGGIGLISMRERTHLVGGEFRLTSGPGVGTQIMVRIPINRGQRKST